MTSFGNILHSHEPEPRQCIRRLESLNKKKISAHYAVVFNKTCIYIYIYRVAESMDFFGDSVSTQGSNIAVHSVQLCIVCCAGV